MATYCAALLLAWANLAARKNLCVPLHAAREGDLHGVFWIDEFLSFWPAGLRATLGNIRCKARFLPRPCNPSDKLFSLHGWSTMPEHNVFIGIRLERAIGAHGGLRGSRGLRRTEELRKRESGEARTGCRVATAAVPRRRRFDEIRPVRFFFWIHLPKLRSRAVSPLEEDGHPGRCRRLFPVGRRVESGQRRVWAFGPCAVIVCYLAETAYFFSVRSCWGGIPEEHPVLQEA